MSSWDAITTRTYTWGYAWPLHFIQYSSDLSKLCQMCSVRVQSSLLAFPCWNRVDEDFRDTTRMYLEMKGPRNQILPDLELRSLVNALPVTEQL